MATLQLQLAAVLLLLASRLAHSIPLRSLNSRPLRDDSEASAGSTTDADGRSGGSGNTALAVADTFLKMTPANSSSSATASPPWELELAPFLSDIPPLRDRNATALRGPPRLAGVYKGSWLRTAYGASLRPQDTLSSERGVIILRLPEDQNPGGPGGPGTLLGGGAHLPGGIQELRGELVIRDGNSVGDRDLRFHMRGAYVAAAGTVHAVLEPQLPLTLRAELDPSPKSDSDSESGADPDLDDEDFDLGLDSGVAGQVGLVQQQRRRRRRQQRQTQHGLESGSADGDGGTDGSGYREALRTAARNLVLLGPAWHRTLVRQPPPPPRPPRGGARLRRAAAEGLGDGPPLPPPSPPRPPLELALLQKCELRADFRVYYKGDPSAKAHLEFLRLDQPAPPPSPPGVKRGGGAAAAGPSPQTAAAAAVAHQPALTASLPVAAAAAADTAVRQQRRRLSADTEIYHSTQMQLHSVPAAAGIAATAAAGDDDGATAAAAPEAVYGIPSGMDPLDPDLELIGLLMSPNCDFAVHFNASSVHLERYYRQAVRYSVLVAAVTIAQIVLSVSQSEASSTPSAAARMSLYSVTLQAILDAYQCLLHLTGALVVDALFAAFASIAFLQFLLFAVFEMRQTLLVWRAQRTNGTGGGGDFWSARRDMSAVYFRFYALMLLGLLLMFQYRAQLPLLVLMLHSWWVPQLLHSARSDTRPPLKATYVWGMSALRLILPLYFYGCPSNLLRVEQQPGVCVALVGWVGLQAALVTAQMRLGPRVFIPRAVLPRRYDYHRPATKREMGIEEPHSHLPAGGTGTGAGGGGGPPSASASASSGAGGPDSGWWRWWRGLWPLGFRAASLRRLASWFRRPWASASGLFAGGGGGGLAARSAAAVAALHRAAAGDRRSGGGGGPDGDGDVETGNGSKECVICMNPVPLLPLGSRMLTPCGHFFHEPCLTRWMEVKMDCPTCRRPLPPA